MEWPCCDTLATMTVPCAVVLDAEGAQLQLVPDQLAVRRAVTAHFAQHQGEG